MQILGRQGLKQVVDRVLPMGKAEGEGGDGQADLSQHLQVYSDINPSQLLYIAILSFINAL